MHVISLSWHFHYNVVSDSQTKLHEPLLGLFYHVIRPLLLRHEALITGSWCLYYNIIRHESVFNEASFARHYGCCRGQLLSLLFLLFWCSKPESSLGGGVFISLMCYACCLNTNEFDGRKGFIFTWWSCIVLFV